MGFNMRMVGKGPGKFREFEGTRVRGKSVKNSRFSSRWAWPRVAFRWSRRLEKGREEGAGGRGAVAVADREPAPSTSLRGAHLARRRKTDSRFCGTRVPAAELQGKSASPRAAASLSRRPAAPRLAAVCAPRPVPSRALRGPRQG